MSQKGSRKKKIGDNEPVRLQLQGLHAGRKPKRAEGTALKLDCPDCGSFQYLPSAGLNDIHVCRECGVVMNEDNVKHLRKKLEETESAFASLYRAAKLAGRAMNSALDELQKLAESQKAAEAARESLTLFSASVASGNR